MDDHRQERASMGHENPECDAPGMPKRDHSFQRVQVYSTTPASEAQVELIKSKVYDLPRTPISDGSSITEQNKAHERYGNRFEVIKQRHQRISCLFGIALLRARRAISEEASHVLYGENLLVFHSARVHRYDALNTVQYLLNYLSPGSRNPRSKEQAVAAIEKLMSMKDKPGSFVDQDHFLHFIGVIGQDNASKVRNIKFNGFFSNFCLTSNEEPWLHYSYPGLQQLLPIYTAILNHVYIDGGHKLTLHLGEGNRGPQFYQISPALDD